MSVLIRLIFFLIFSGETITSSTFLQFSSDFATSSSFNFATSSAILFPKKSPVLLTTFWKHFCSPVSNNCFLYFLANDKNPYPLTYVLVLGSIE